VKNKKYQNPNIKERGKIDRLYRHTYMIAHFIDMHTWSPYFSRLSDKRVREHFYGTNNRVSG
jgi:hypothetical protein